MWPILGWVLPEPLSPPDAKRLIHQIMSEGSVAFSSHAKTELAKDNLTTVDAVNVLRGGVVEPAEFENGSWRYRVRTGTHVRGGLKDPLEFDLNNAA